MSIEIVTWIFFVMGVLLVASELVLPGMVSVFLGASAIVVALLRWVGILEGLPASVATWMVMSVVMVLALRKAAMRFFPADVEIAKEGDVDEDLQTYGQVVEVIEDCDEATGKPGRIMLDGVAWNAHSTQGILKKGTQAKVCYRKNMTWFVEPQAALDAHEESVVPVTTKEETREK